MKDLRGKRALLTGASTGIGPHIARRLAREGVDFVLSARNEKALQSLATELGGADVIVADLSVAGEAERLAREAGAIDILISNAGIPATGTLPEFSATEIDRAIDVNLRSAIHLARAVLPKLLRKGEGHIVFMASVAGKVPAPGASIYNATKFGLRGFAHALREETHGSGVGVSVVNPTFVSESGMWAETGLKAHPMAGEVTPAQVAEAVFRCIRQNRAEIDVVPVQLKASLAVMAVAPEVAKAVARRSGASAVSAEVAERQKHKR